MKSPSNIRTSAKSRAVKRRRGNIVVLFAFMLTFVMGMVALGVDIGYVTNGHAQLQNAVDAGALAGAAVLVDAPNTVVQESREFAQANLFYNQQIPDDKIEVYKGVWNRNTQTFSTSNANPNAVRVVATMNDQPLFFAKAIGQDIFGLSKEAIATYYPRDIVVILDFSASMNDDSELRSFKKMGKQAVLANLYHIYLDLGSPQYGKLKWNTVQCPPNKSIDWVMQRLELDEVAYPHPGGSWEDYISYVKTSSNLNAAGFQDRYGYPTLINYWLERRPSAADTPALSNVRAQPVTAVKNAMTLFVDYLKAGDINDRIALSVYTSSNGTAVLEQGLTYNLDSVDQIARQRQAGHYDLYTNIGSGLARAIDELDANARPSVTKLIVLMTDGLANRPVDTSTAKTYVRQQAARAANAGFPVVTISLGAGADAALMQEVADTTNGTHFNIPGGSTVAQYERDLRDTFKAIADHRPLKLVK